ncbi:hypothetical protein BDV29DRAFT_168799 [Aspergillus leporis]|jgi:hypothetical protein|uniref:Uncharacterized protein n=1 Tax=Aspergillus leporis TaxID=41062 RepID=A0A5N5XAI6_9EURO|nr:hypothetical protein BDV29DRAFT_168799 [Aspergillus leporis]
MVEHQTTYSLQLTPPLTYPANPPNYPQEPTSAGSMTAWLSSSRSVRFYIPTLQPKEPGKRKQTRTINPHLQTSKTNHKNKTRTIKAHPYMQTVPPNTTAFYVLDFIPNTHNKLRGHDAQKL